MKILDILAPIPELYVFKDEKFYSSISKLISVSKLISILVFTSYFIATTLLWEKIFITFNSNSQLPKVVNLTNTTIMFSIIYSLGNNFEEQDRLFSINSQYGRYEISYSNNNVSTPNRILNPIKKLQTRAFWWDCGYIQYN